MFRPLTSLVRAAFWKPIRKCLQRRRATTSFTAAQNVLAFANAVNVAGVNTADSVAVSSTSAAYAGKSIYGSTLNNNLNFSNAGTLANSSYESGLNFMRIDGLSGGIAKSIYTQYVDKDIGR